MKLASQQTPGSVGIQCFILINNSNTCQIPAFWGQHVVLKSKMFRPLSKNCQGSGATLMGRRSQVCEPRLHVCKMEAI